MNKKWYTVLFIAILMSLLIGCSDKKGEENNDFTGDNEEENNEEENNELENDDENNKNNNENEEENLIDEDSFANEIRVLDVETVLHNQKEVSGLDPEVDTLIEHEERVYIENDFITEVLDYELTYDETNTLVEVFKRKGDFTYEPAYEEDGGALLTVGQVYVEDLDKYETIDGGEADLYEFVEYEGKLYVPKRLIEVFLKAPVNYERRDKTLELGEKAEATSLYDIGIAKGSSITAEVTQSASDVTIEGTNYEEGIILRDINSAVKGAILDLDYNYSKVKGFIYNRSEKETLEVGFQYEDKKTLESVEIKPGKQYKFDFDVNGEKVLIIVAKGPGGRNEEIAIIGEAN